MTIEQILAKLDEIALEAARIEQCGVCHRSYFMTELSECGSCGARVCVKCNCAGQLHLNALGLAS